MLNRLQNKAIPALRKPMPARQWLWLAFSRHALIPLLVVECLLIAVYFASIQTVNQRNVDYLRNTAVAELGFSADRYAALVGSQLSSIEQQLRLYRDAILTAFAQQDYQPPADELARRRFNEQGVYHTFIDNGGSATFYPTPRDGSAHNLARSHRLIALDPLMRSFVQHSPLVTQVYFNDAGSFNHIYPYFDVVNQYPHDVDVTQFSFFYLADPIHNPQQQTRWTEVYLDPAGQGWMTSAVIPVYEQQQFVGVAGFDVAISDLIAQVQQFALPWQGFAMLIDAQLNIVALSAEGAAKLQLQALPMASDATKVQQLTTLSTDYNLAQYPGLQGLVESLQQTQGTRSLAYNDQQLMMGWQRIVGTDWTLITVVDEDNLFAATNQLRMELSRVAYWMVVGLVLFYIAFFSFIWFRTRSFSAVLERAIHGLLQRIKIIESGDYRRRPAVTTGLSEMNDLGQGLEHMAAVLDHYVVALADREARMRRAIENSGDVVIEINFDDGYFDGCSALYRLLGINDCANQLPISQVMSRVHPADQAAAHAVIDRELVASTGYDFEFRMIDAHEQPLWLQARGKGVKNEQGQVHKIIATISLIHHRKLAELHLQEAKQAAEQASRAKSLFLSSITHELRTPLSAIVGFTQITELGPLNEFQTTALAQIKQASLHLQQLVDDLLTQSELEANALSIEIKPIQVHDSIVAAMQMLEQLAKDRNVTFHYVQHETPACQADARRLQQILVNLMSNAVKYNRRDGQVYITTDFDEKKVRIHVRDEGFGIRAENLERIFDPFVRIGKETTDIQGTGIGLTISRELARKMEATISVHSTLDQGSIFTISMVRAGVAT